MYFGRLNNKSSILNKEPEKPEGLSSRDRVKQKTEAFTKKMRFNGYIASGMPPEQAARMLGIKVPFGGRISIGEILRKIGSDQDY